MMDPISSCSPTTLKYLMSQLKNRNFKLEINNNNIEPQEKNIVEEWRKTISTWDTAQCLYNFNYIYEGSIDDVISQEYREGDETQVRRCVVADKSMTSRGDKYYCAFVLPPC